MAMTDQEISIRLWCINRIQPGGHICPPTKHNHMLITSLRSKLFTETSGLFLYILQTSQLSGLFRELTLELATESLKCYVL
jgi:hypothetical protein